mmetsp:Transcript_32046/g.94291  ORF Transcript_32046/g.94291 Transcript_32046/m.94291 type:complete len:201 (-) Transcript_32046:343-945(-)
MRDDPDLDSLAKFPSTDSSRPKYTRTSAATTRSKPCLSSSERPSIRATLGARSVSSNDIASRSRATNPSYSFGSCSSAISSSSASSSMPHPFLRVHFAALSSIFCEISTPTIGPVTIGRKNRPANPVPAPASNADTNLVSSPRALAAAAPIMPGTRYSKAPSFSSNVEAKSSNSAATNSGLARRWTPSSPPSSELIAASM